MKLSYICEIFLQVFQTNIRYVEKNIFDMICPEIKILTIVQKIIYLYKLYEFHIYILR